MPESKPPAKIYQESLSNLQIGIPLWVPEPINHSVEIGDVGFFDQTGAWFRVFNILSSEDSTRAAPLPPGFQPLDRARYTISKNQQYMHPNVYSSSRIESKELQAGVHIGEYVVTIILYTFLAVT